MLNNAPWGKFTEKVHKKREEDDIQNNPNIFLPFISITQYF